MGNCSSSSFMILGRDWIRKYQPVCNWLDRTFKWPPKTVPVSGPNPKLEIRVSAIGADGPQYVFHAFLNTGAKGSSIARQEQEQLGLVKIGPSTDGNAINGTRVESFGTFEMPACISGDTTASKVLIHDTRSSSMTISKMVLGMDWVAKYQPVCDRKNGTWTWPDTLRGMVAKAADGAEYEVQAVWGHSRMTNEFVY